MPIVIINGHDVNVDVRAELEEFEWTRPKWSYDKLIAASPFRYDRSPSFFVRLEPFGEFPAGTWADSGYYDEEYKSGNFVKLMSFLRNETYEETSDYLLTKYVELSETSNQRLILPNLAENRGKTVLNRAIIDVLKSSYLESRSISESVQAQALVGRSRYRGFVAIPWYDANGDLANVKYRATRGKAFFYEKGGRPIRELVYGADLYKRYSGDLILCEAEIDALSWRTAGVEAVAVGGVAFTHWHADILRRLPFSRLIVAGDNDKAGAKFNEQVVGALRKDKRIGVLDWRGKSEKDANDLLCGSGGIALRATLADVIDVSNNLLDWNVKIGAK